MCSEYQVKTSTSDIQKALGTPVKLASGAIEWDKTIKFSTKAPVIQNAKLGLELVERVFPVSPFPNSRLSGFENQSDGKDESTEDDKQIQRIYEKPRWKTPFAAHPLLVPMTGFTEYAYWGDRAGSALAFDIPKDEVFFAAAIGIKPFVPKTGKEDGFSILTHTATEQMLEYHQRLIVLLRGKHAANYLEEMTPQERFEFLIENRYTGKLNISKTRNMAKGWEKRIPVQLAKLHRETQYRKTLKKEQVDG
jgi:putative SOS response-associated peptidase YedK